MFNKDYMPNIRQEPEELPGEVAARPRRHPTCKFYIGELCTKTIWGMDLRPRMYEISVGQKDV